VEEGTEIVMKIRVKLGTRSCSVFIVRGVLAKTSSRVRKHFTGRVIYVCSSRPVKPLHGALLGKAVEEAGYGVHWLRIPDGERAKTLGVVGDLLERLARLGAGRGSCLIALGGGTVGDVTGFTAGIFMRGIPFIQVPTTLVGQVDAAIDGKTGVDLPEGHSLAGVFHQPGAVVSDTAILSSLSRRQSRAGLSEVAKDGIIMSPRFFPWLERDAPRLACRAGAALERAITEPSRMKAGKSAEG